LASVHFRPQVALRQFTACAAAALSLVTAAACTSHKSKPAPNLSASAASASAAAALADLKHQASAAEALSFTASYEAQGNDPPRTGTVKVFHTPTALRIDVDEAGTNVRILVTDKGTFSCKFSGGAGKNPLCVTLAGPGQSIPATLDPGLQHLFTSALDEIISGTGLHVGPAPDQTSAASGSPASCFAIASVPSGSDLAPGTYCFANGLLTSAEFRASSLRLTKVGPAPSTSDFALPAQPAPLASGSASPTRS